MPAAGGTPVKLNGPLATPDGLLGFAISPNSARVVYRAAQATAGLVELYSVPIGGGPSTKPVSYTHLDVYKRQLLTTAPAMTVLMAQFLLPDERLTVRKGVGILLALAGAALVVLRGESGLAGVAGRPIGYAIVMGAIVIDSFMVVYTRKHCREYDTADLSSVRLLTAARRSSMTRYLACR